MAKAKVSRAPAKKGRTKPVKKQEEKRVSEMGRILQKLSDDYARKGGRLYTQEEIEREICENRCG
jgi:hypothetical protein